MTPRELAEDLVVRCSLWDVAEPADLCPDEVLRLAMWALERDDRLIEIAGRKRGAVADRIDWDDVPLGVESDNEIARRLDCDAETVRRARVKRGIRAAPKPGQKRHGPEPQVPAQIVPMFGTMPDAEIARQASLRLETVRTWRVRLGIAPAPSAAQRMLAHMRTDPGRAWYARELWEQVRPAVDVTGAARALIARGLVERTSVGRYRLVGP